MSAQDQQNSDRIVRNIDYLQVLKNRWKEVFLVFLLVLVISVVVTFLMPPSYRATSQFQIKLPKPVMDIGRGGDVVATSNVTANYIPMQYSATLYQMTDNYDDAYDIAQEAFSKAYRALRYFNGQSAFYTWRP